MVGLELVLTPCAQHWASGLGSLSVLEVHLRHGGECRSTSSTDRRVGHQVAAGAPTPTVTPESRTSAAPVTTPTYSPYQYTHPEALTPSKSIDQFHEHKPRTDQTKIRANPVTKETRRIDTSYEL